VVYHHSAVKKLITILLVDNLAATRLAIFVIIYDDYEVFLNSQLPNGRKFLCISVVKSEVNSCKIL